MDAVPGEEFMDGEGDLGGQRAPASDDAIMNRNLPPSYPHADEELEEPPCCWWCGCVDCLFGGYLNENPQPYNVRKVDCVVLAVFRYSGMYVGGNFNREKYLRLREKNKAPSGLDIVRNVWSRDTTVSSTFQPGLEIPVRLFSAPKTTTTGKKSPIIIYIHGGGWCVGSPRDLGFHVLCTKFVMNGYTVVSVDYRLAPEHPFPAALYDSFDVVRWVATKPAIDEFANANFSDITLCGDSAGANLACVITSLMRDGLGPDLKPCPLDLRISRQLLFYPALMMKRYVNEKPPKKLRCFTNPLAISLHKVIYPERHCEKKDN